VDNLLNQITRQWKFYSNVLNFLYAWVTRIQQHNMHVHTISYAPGTSVEKGKTGGERV
jgi:hypothetical protein